MGVPWYYRLLIGMAVPVYRYLVGKRSAKLPTVRRELGERFGQAYLPVPVSSQGLVWCHAVSLGELNTAYPLLKLLLNQGFALWITSTTQTGFNRASVLFADTLGKSVNHSFVPVDSASIVAKFLAHIQPVLALFVETELWATTLYELKKRHIPSVMVNARLTQKSFNGYQRFARISQSMMANLSYIIAQDHASAERFKQLGANNVCVMDSLKWSSGQALSPANQALVQSILADKHWQLDRPIWVAGSTHAGEEQMAIAVHRQLRQSHPTAVLIIVPRHPERFDEVAQMCQGMTTHRRSLAQSITSQTQIYLADSMGELSVWYALAQVVLVGGSLVDVGGHNPIEPAVLAKPIIMGRYVKNCQVLVDELTSVSALVQVDGETGLFEELVGLFGNLEYARARGVCGQRLVANKQNAALCQFDKIMQVLEAS